jgi:hypothetical protein
VIIRNCETAIRIDGRPGPVDERIAEMIRRAFEEGITEGLTRREIPDVAAAEGDDDGHG